MRSAGILSLKNILIFSTLSGAFIATPFLFKNSSNNLFNLAKVKGLTTRVGIFLNGFEKLRIQQVEQVSSISSHKQKKADLIAEFQLDNLNNQKFWKVCIPNNSLFKVRENNELTSSDSSINKKLCETKNLDSIKDNPNIEIIKELLSKATQFLQVENAHNILLPNEDNVYFSELSNKKKRNPTEELKSIKEICNLSEEGWKNYLKELMQANPKNCFLSPSSMRVNFDLNERDSEVETRTVSNENQQLKIEDISKSTLSGRLDYSLFDFSTGKRKKIKVNNDSHKEGFLFFQFRNKNKYSLIEEGKKNCKLGLKNLYELIENKEIKLNDLILDNYCYR